jgi:hypothetical protein
MTFKVFAFVVGLMVPAFACLAFAWPVQVNERTEPAGKGWRRNVLTAALYFASLSQLLVLGSLLQGFHPDRQSFTEPAPFPWVIANWIIVIGWSFVVIASVLGKGRTRLPLFLWSGFTLLAFWLVVMVGMDY